MNSTLEQHVKSMKLEPMDIIPGYGFIRYFRRNKPLNPSFIDFLDVQPEQATYEDCIAAVSKERKYYQERISNVLLLAVYTQMTCLPAINIITEKIF